MGTQFIVQLAAIAWFQDLRPGFPVTVRFTGNG